MKQYKTIVFSFLSGLVGGLVAIFMASYVFGSFNFSWNTAQSSQQTSGTPQVQASAVVNTNTVTDVYEKTKNAVVSVINLQAQNSSLFSSQSSTDLTTASTGSGVIYKVEGNTAYVVTNYHVIDGSQALQVMLADGTVLEGTLVGSDQWTDLAVLKMDASKVSVVAEFANSDEVKAGEMAIAIGSPLGTEFASTVTAGIVSATDRAVESDVNGDSVADWIVTAIQTDAAINPGNSGGALLNEAGQVIGINSMKISTSNVEGMGFAIPSNEVVAIISELEKSGEMKRPVLGITMANVSNLSTSQLNRLNILNVSDGVIIAKVTQNGAAQKAGLENYDVITAIDGQSVSSIAALRKILYSHKDGDQIEVTYYRKGEKRQTTVQLSSSTDPGL